MRRLVCAILGVAFPLQVLADGVETSAGRMEISLVAEGFDEPWAIAILPDGAVLVTERAGRLRLVREGAVSEVAGMPQVYDEGQGGLLDVMVPRDFAETREVWVSFAAPVGEGAGTAAGKGRLSNDGTRLEGFVTLFRGDAFPAGVTSGRGWSRCRTGRWP